MTPKPGRKQEKADKWDLRGGFDPQACETKRHADIALLHSAHAFPKKDGMRERELWCESSGIAPIARFMIAVFLCQV